MKKKNTKLIIGVVIIIAAVVYLIASSTLSQSQYFLTVEELQSNQAEYVGKNVRMSGAVLGDTIEYDPQTLELTFQVAQIPGDQRVIEQTTYDQQAAPYSFQVKRWQQGYHALRLRCVRSLVQAKSFLLMVEQLK